MRFLCSQSILKAVGFYQTAPHTAGADDSFYSAVKDKPGLPCKRVLLGNVLHDLHKLPDHIQNFIKKHGEVYVLPIEDVSCIRAIFFRAILTKDFRMIFDGNPMMYGLFRFKKFKYGDLVILSEGIKDAEAIARFYPYSLAVLTNRVTQKQSEVLKRLTDNFVFVADSDKWGHENERLNLRAGAKSVFYVPGGKDPGEYFEKEGVELENLIKGIVITYNRGKESGNDGCGEVKEISG